jgi:hypothetical protein
MWDISVYTHPCVCISTGIVDYPVVDHFHNEERNPDYSSK